MPEQAANNPEASKALKGVYEAYISRTSEANRPVVQPTQPHVQVDKLGNAAVGAGHEVSFCDAPAPFSANYLCNPEVASRKVLQLGGLLCDLRRRGCTRPK